MTELADANPATTGEQKELPPRDADTGRFVKEPQKRKTVREELQDALAEQKRKAAEADKPKEEPKKAPPQKAATEEPEAEEEELPEGEVQAAEEDTSELDEPKGERRVTHEASGEEDDEDDAETKPQVSKAAAPASWNKEERAVWDSMPPAAQKAVLRREADTAKGVDKLKQEITGLKDQTRDIEEAVAPYKAMILQMGRTPGQAVRGLFDWQMALAGPQKEQAFRQLAANLGINLQNLVTGAQAPVQAEAPANEVPAEFRPVLDQYGQRIDQLQNRLQSYETNALAQQQQAADQMIENWAKNKPHFAAVRERMGELINADIRRLQANQPALGGYILNGNIDLDKAYEDAIWAHPEVRKQIRDEELAQSQQERLQKTRAEVKTAKKASVSIKPAAPTPPPPAPKKKPGQVESARESILRAMQELGATR